MICNECKKERLTVVPMYTTIGSRDMCPICALKVRNKFHGLPKETPFQGITAQMIYDKEVEYEKQITGE